MLIIVIDVISKGWLQKIEVMEGKMMSNPLHKDPRLPESFQG